MASTENKTPESRLLAVGWDVDDNGCWIVRAKPLGNGYVTLYLSGENYVGAHRLAYRAWHGEIPENSVVRHSCHVRNCINPEHLSVGTHQDNMDDKTKAGRQARGETHGNALLSNDDAVDIVLARNAGIGSTELAERYGVSRTAIKDIVRGYTYAEATKDIERNVPKPGPSDGVLRQMWKLYCQTESVKVVAGFFGYKYTGAYRQLTKLAGGKLKDAILDPEVVPLWDNKD